tara:strand:- start:13996 stop:14589 length:594 start_codon:yes stop_codon:yes gene_type:complete
MTQYTDEELYEKIMTNLNHMTSDEKYSVYATTREILKLPRSNVELTDKIEILINPRITIKTDEEERSGLLINDLDEIDKVNIMNYFKQNLYDIILTIFSIDVDENNKFKINLSTNSDVPNTDITVQLKKKGNNVIVQLAKLDNVNNFNLDELTLLKYKLDESDIDNNEGWINNELLYFNENDINYKLFFELDEIKKI